MCKYYILHLIIIIPLDHHCRFTASSLPEEDFCHLPWWQSCLCDGLGSQTCWDCWHCWPLGWRGGGCGSPSHCNWPYARAFVLPAAPGRLCWLDSFWGAWRAWRARLCCGGQQSTDTRDSHKKYSLYAVLYPTNSKPIILMLGVTTTSSSSYNTSD